MGDGTYRHSYPVTCCKFPSRGRNTISFQLLLRLMDAWAMQQISKITGDEDEIALALLDDVLDKPKPNPVDLEFTLAGILPAEKCRPFVEVCIATCHSGSSVGHLSPHRVELCPVRPQKNVHVSQELWSFLVSAMSSPNGVPPVWFRVMAHLAHVSYYGQHRAV
eukprot:scaffold473505_cov48-Prasinocladus_malaysianus.AAC.1